LAGPDAARQIRSTDPYVPIIGITAAGDLDTTKACLHAGMNSVIQKPVSVAISNNELHQF
jgi:CheY-like chemotaxis protein